MRCPERGILDHLGQLHPRVYLLVIRLLLAGPGRCAGELQAGSGRGSRYALCRGNAAVPTFDPRRIRLRRRGQHAPGLVSGWRGDHFHMAVVRCLVAGVGVQPRWDRAAGRPVDRGRWPREGHLPARTQDDCQARLAEQGVLLAGSGGASMMVHETEEISVSGFLTRAVFIVGSSHGRVILQ